MPEKSREPFAPTDAAWLRMEDPTNLMMITGVLMFDGPVSVARLGAVIEERLLKRFERFRKRVVMPSGGLGGPVWEEDPHFALSAHLHRAALPAPGGQAELEELVSDLMSTPLDFSKPPWQFHLVESGTGGCALIVRLHHCIADGIALVHVLLSLTDAEPHPPPAEPDGDAARPERGPLQSLAHAAEAARRAGEAALREGQGLLAEPERALELARIGADGAAALGKLLFMPPDPHTILKGKLGVRKRAVWSQPIALADIKAIGRLTGATINDVLLSAVSGALRAYLQHRGAPVDGLNIRAVVPVNLRPLDRPPTLGNMFGVVFLALPIGVEDSLDRLTTLRERMAQIKGSPEAVVALGILDAMGRSPERIQDIAVEMFGSKATAVMTNVPGPRQTLYLAGAPIDGIMFWVPQSGRLGLGVSIMSYAGRVLVGVATDVGLIPDPAFIVDAFHRELDDLCRLARLLEV